MGVFRGVELDELTLSADRLLLRRWQPSDAERVHAIMQNRTMREFLALPDPYTPETAKEFVTDIGHEGRGAGTGLGCAVVERSSGRVVGAAALRLSGDPNVGYWIAPDARGNGYAAELTRALCDWAFSVGVPRIALDCDVRNLASVRTALAAGFRYEGVARAGTIRGAAEAAGSCRADLARFARLADDPPVRVPYAFPQLPPDGLSDGVLALRAVRPGDAAAIVETEDELTVHWNFTGARESAAEIQRKADAAGLDWLVGSVARCAMVDVGSGALAGTLELRKAGPPQVGGIGYVVHPAFRGRGYTTRALRLLAQWAFEHDFARLELGAKSGNLASQRAAAAADFAADGVRRARLRNADGSFSDEVRFALINPRYAT